MPDQNETQSAFRSAAMRTARSRKSMRRPRLVADQRRVVLAVRVEQVPRAGLDDAPQPEPVQQPGDVLGLLDHVVGVRVEVVVVEGERDGGVAEVGDHPQRVVEAVVGEPVGAVAEVEAGHVGLTFLRQRTGERQRGGHRERAEQRAAPGGDRGLERDHAVDAGHGGPPDRRGGRILLCGELRAADGRGVERGGGERAEPVPGRAGTPADGGGGGERGAGERRAGGAGRRAVHLAAGQRGDAERVPADRGGGGQRRRARPPAPMRTSSARQAAMPAGPAGVDLSTVS